MHCHGSANLELAIPGFIEPVKDDVTRNAKNIGTDVHTVVEPFHDMPLPDLLMYGRVIMQYQALHITKRRVITDTEQNLVKWFHDIGQAWDVKLVDWMMLVGQGGFTPKMMRFIFEVSNAVAAINARLKKRNLGSNQRQAISVGEVTLVCDWLPSAPKTTPDVVWVGDGVLEICDYKSGAIKVSPVDNDQLLFYAASAWNNWDDFIGRPREIVLHVMQPGNIDSWSCSFEYLQEWMARAVAADNAIQAKDLRLRPSDHCTFCPANPHTRGDKGNVFCRPMLDLLYPPVVDEDEIFA